MLKQDELDRPDSCLNKARPDELIFVLLERDPAAIMAVNAWISERIARGLNAKDDEKIQSAIRWQYAVIARNGIR